MRSLAHRAMDAEWLDLGVASDETKLSLADLRRVNDFLGGWSSVRSALVPWLRGGERLRILDVGCGSADIAGRLVRLDPEHVAVVGLDLKPAHLEEAPPGVARVAGDVRRMPFRDRSFDVVLCSLFLHHFDGHEVAEILRRLFAVARRALIVSDLHRARVPYVFGRAFFPLIFRSRVSVHDGLVSIRRGFKPGELKSAFAHAGIADVAIVRRFPYRLVAVARRQGS